MKAINMFYLAIFVFWIFVTAGVILNNNIRLDVEKESWLRDETYVVKQGLFETNYLIVYLVSLVCIEAVIISQIIIKLDE